ncbi:MAG TPA: hypothetical protein VE398_12555 [Acidobacteriota bacterium]|nr:hypothetical protein [Acidobacteriota bacterium]
MKVLLVSEGEHEQAGALQTLVSRLSPGNFEFESDRVSRDDIHAYHGKGPGYFKRAVRWLGEARKRGFEALILVIDEDGRTERTTEFEQAQKYEKVEMRRALGVAIRTFDAWMLADEQALTSVLGSPIPPQPKPERLTDPKRECRRLHDDSQNQMALREIYACLAQVADIGILEARCPKGFAPFAARVRAL